MGTVLSQKTFIKTYDFFDAVSETARNMFVIDELVYIIGSGGCDAGPCLHYYVLNVDGEVLMTKRYPDIAPTTRCWLRDSSIYVAGRQRLDTLESRDGYRLYKLGLDGVVQATSKYDLNDLADPPDYPILKYYPRGTIANDEKIVVYGDTSENDGISDNYYRGLLVYYNKDLSFDTLVFINPRYRNMEMWNADLDTSENFSFLFDYNEWENGEEIDYRTYAIYNSEGAQLFRWNPPELYFDRYIFLDHKISSSNEVILYLTPTSNDFDPGHDLIVVDNEKEIRWRRIQRFAQVQLGILDISESLDNNILVAGFSDSPHQGSHIRKVDVSNGEVIWDRAFRDFDDEATGNALTNFYNVKELPDGTLLVAGTRSDKKYLDSTTYISHHDLQLLRLDAEGCLEAGCGGLEQIIGGIAPYVPLPYYTHRWHYQKYDTEQGIFKQAFKKVSGLGNVYKENRAEEILAIDGGGWPTRSSKLLSLENEGRKIYYIEDYDVSQEEVLLYDFTLEVGDLFYSDYIDQPLEVIESDTMRLTDRSKMRYWVLACTENPEQTITWMENIGTYHGVAWPKDFCSGAYGDEELTCFYRHYQLAHMNPDVSDCLIPSSISDLDRLSLSDITVLPNPTSGALTISSSGKVNIDRIELLDTHGVEHVSFHSASSEVTMDLSGYPSGLYYVSIYTEKGTVVKKVVVQ